MVHSATDHEGDLWTILVGQSKITLRKRDAWYWISRFFIVWCIAQGSENKIPPGEVHDWLGSYGCSSNVLGSYVFNHSTGRRCQNSECNNTITGRVWPKAINKVFCMSLSLQAVSTTVQLERKTQTESEYRKIKQTNKYQSLFCCVST